MAELERLAHHINDVGAICNDASVLTIHARCALQREDVLSVADACFGHRLMMDRIVPGGVAADLSSEGVGRVRGLLARFEATRAEIQRVYDSLPSLQDRTVTTGIVSPELVAPVRRRRLRRPRVRPRLRRAQGASPMRPMTSLISTQDADRRRRRCASDGAHGRDRGKPRAVHRLLDRLTPGPIASEPPPVVGGRGRGAGRGLPRRCLRERALRRGRPACPGHARDAAGSNGRCWRPRSRATSSPTSRSATSRSTVPTRATIYEAPA